MSGVLVFMSVRDRAIDAFTRPFVVQSNGQAIRSFQEEVNSDVSKSTIAKHPEDYDLYRIGTFDEASGRLTPEEPKMIAVGKEMVIKAS